MSNESRKKESYNDLKALFLPDILHFDKSHDGKVKKEDEDPLQEISRLIGQTNKPSGQSRKDTQIGTLNNTTDENFLNFMDNNSFINTTVPNESEHFLNHYSGFIPEEASFYQGRHMNSMLGHQQLFPSSSLPMASKVQHGMSLMDMNWANYVNTGNLATDRPLEGSPSLNASMYPTSGMNSPMKSIMSRYQWGQGTPTHQMLESENDADVHLHTISNKGFKSKKSNTKAKKAAPVSAKINIAYKPNILIPLLDLKKSELETQNFRIVDKNDAEVRIRFSSFLNGRFFTNDVDNSNYLMMKSGEKGHLDNGEGNYSQDNNYPMVISCYRRNHIQILMNFNISGMSDPESVLRLSTSEYGYAVTRVIKWFKIEVFANTNVSNSRNIPIVIQDETREKVKDEAESSGDTEIIHPVVFDKLSNIVTTGDMTSTPNNLNNYYMIKKLQFKNATPNNGNTTFQNYYNLKVKLSAIVADLYYDDYMDEDFREYGGENERNEITICELTSEPIIVRGRNPSFYAERKDVLLKGRNPSSRQSFIDAENSERILEINPISNNSSHELPNNEKAYANTNRRAVENDQLKKIDQTLDTSNKPNEIEHDVEESNEEPSDDEKTGQNMVLKSNIYYTGKERHLPPVMYNAVISNSIDIKSVLEDSNKSSSAETSKQESRYKYFPISNIYYLPPINVVYFPHIAHQHDKSSERNADSTNGDSTDPANNTRKNSKVYF